MSIFESFKKRERVREFMSCTAYDDDAKIMYHERDNALSCILQFPPISGGGQNTLKTIQTILAMEFPAGTLLSFTNFGSPYLPDVINPYLAERNTAMAYGQSLEQNRTMNIARMSVRSRAEFINQGSRKKLIPSVDTRILSSTGYFSIKVPLKNSTPYKEKNSDLNIEFEKEKRNFVDLINAIIAQGKSCHLYFKHMEEEDVMAMYRRYFNPFGATDTSIDATQTMNNQFDPVGSRMSWNKIRHEDIHFKGFNENGEQNYAGILSIERYPLNENRFAWYRMIEMLGNVDGAGVQIGMPYALTTVIHYPDQQKKIMKLRQDQALTDKQSTPTFLKWNERLKLKSQSYPEMNRALLENNKVVEVSTSLTLFNRSKREIKAACSRLSAYYQNLGMFMLRERYIPAVTFFNMLPANASPESIKKTYRFKTMASGHAAHVLPILDEWQGYGNTLLLNTRLGRTFSMDFFSNLNKNKSFGLAAEAGAGKSCLMNTIIRDYLSVGTKVYLFDKGKSYFGLGAILGAQIMNFDRNTNICLNPFTHVQDINEEMELILPVFAKMADPVGVLNAEEMAILKEAILAQFNKYGNDASVTDVVNYLTMQEAELCHRLGRLLNDFTSTGTMGRWFNGRNTFSSDAQWTILETQDLSSNKHLQQVVLMALSISIEQEVYASNNGRKKLMIIEEGGDLLADETFAKFVASLYSKGRKENTGVGIVVQTLMQLLQAKDGLYGKAILASASTKMFMEQKPEAIQTAIKADLLDVDNYTHNLMMSVNTAKGQYSEVCFVTANGSGIARLIESPFNRVLFSTEGELFNKIRSLVSQGQTEGILELVQQEADRLYPEWAEINTINPFDVLKEV